MHYQKDCSMTNISSFLAWRYLRQTAQDQSSNTMIKIVFLSIAIGSFALALVTAIMHGFEVVIHEKMQGIHSQLTIRSQEPIDLDSLSPVLKEEFPEVKAFSPSAQEHVLVQANDDETISVMMIIGIDPEKYVHTNTLHTKIRGLNNEHINLVDALSRNQILVGSSFAQAADIRIGNTVSLLYSQDLANKGRKITLDKKSAQIGGLYDTGIDEFDMNVLFCSLAFFHQLFPDVGISQVHLTLQPNVNEMALAQRLRTRLELEVVSWKDLYKPLVAALTLEKYVMFLILALITLVACMNMISLLFMQITRKRPDIALLTVMGCSEKTIRNIFIGMSMIITTLSSVCGLIIAWLCSYLLEHYPFITLPDVYYVSHLPAKMTLGILCAVFILVIILSLLATLIATRSLRSIPIAHVLRFEG